MRVRVGDKVLVKNDLEVGGNSTGFAVGAKVRVREDYHGKALIDTMEKFKGKVVTISDITSSGEYHIEEDGRVFFWTAEMFEPVAENDPVLKVKETIPNPDSRRDDPVNHPSHYTDGRIEVIDFIQDKKLNFCRGNIVKYVARAGKKGDKTKEIEDLKKARQYCDFEIKALEGRV